MMKRYGMALGLLTLIGAVASWAGENDAMKQTKAENIEVFDTKAGKLVVSEKVVLADAEWRKRLSPEAFQVMRQHGTERPFSCGRLKDMGEGIYTCAGCGLELFSSDAKFDSGTGWPSFFKPVHPNNIGTTTDYVIGYARTEVHCARCGGHLGHVFEDGPRPTGLRYCMNGVSLTFVPKPE